MGRLNPLGIPCLLELPLEWSERGSPVFLCCHLPPPEWPSWSFAHASVFLTLSYSRANPRMALGAAGRLLLGQGDQRLAWGQ